MPVVQERPLLAACAHDQADRDARDHALSLGASGRGTMIARRFCLWRSRSLRGKVSQERLAKPQLCFIGPPVCRGGPVRSPSLVSAPAAREGGGAVLLPL